MYILLSFDAGLFNVNILDLCSEIFQLCILLGSLSLLIGESLMSLVKMNYPRVTNQNPGIIISFWCFICFTIIWQFYMNLRIFLYFQNHLSLKEYSYPVEQCQQLNKAKFIFHFSHFWRNENFEVQMTFFLKYIKSANILNGLNLNIDILWRKGWIKSLQNDWPSNSAFMDSTKQNKPIDYTKASTVQNPV